MTGSHAPGAQQPRVTIVVPAFNAMRYLPQTIPALCAAVHQHGAAELVFADNGSTDGTLAWIERHGCATRVLQLPGVTISALRNAGARVGKGQLLSFIDADCLVPPHYLERAEGVMADPAIAACGSRYLLPEAPQWVERVWQQLHDGPGGDADVVYLPAGNFVVRRNVFATVGGFREDLVTGEDADLGLRMTEQGFITRSTPAVWVRHLGNPTSLRAFYRKQRWHALGMFGTVRRNRIDKPVAMTFAHLAVIVLAVVAAAIRPAMIAGALSAIWIVPIATVLFRWRQGGRVGSAFPAAVLLYQVYYLARIAALFRIVFRARAAT